jgi:hypothetical protein
MMRLAKTIAHVALAIFVGASCLLLDENVSLTNSTPPVASAEARVGRPLTPMSAAGVARRTTRRAVYGTAAVGAAAYGAYGAYGAYAPYSGGCEQVVNSYGRVVNRCH